MDTNRMFTNLFGGWLTAADKAAATTINYTKSTVMPSFSGLTRKATMATGKTLLAAGYKLVDCCTQQVTAILTRIKSLLAVVKTPFNSLHFPNHTGGVP